MFARTALRALPRANTSLTPRAVPRATAPMVQTGIQRMYHQAPARKATHLTTPVAEAGMAGPPPMSLNIREQIHKAPYYQALSRIMEIRKAYVEDRYVFVDGREMVQLLRFLGAKDEDFASLPGTSERLYEDPTLPFRRSRNCRFCFDFDTQSVRRLEFQPFMLSTSEDFKRHDSGQVRRFDEVGNDVQLNTAFQALMVFKGIVMHGINTIHRQDLDYGLNKFVCTLFHLRTFTTPDMLGEPALEGVHTDGVDHTMTTYLGSDNMAPHSAVTFMHDMKEVTGNRLNSTTPELIRARVQHRHYLDTLMIVDNERKHSISPVYAVDDSREATRDMLIFFTRKPVTRDHPSAAIDSLIPHQEMPMEVPLFVANH